MSFEELLRLAAEAYAQLERENAELRREVKRLADQLNETCDDVWELQQRLKEKEVA